MKKFVFLALASVLLFPTAGFCTSFMLESTGNGGLRNDFTGTIGAYLRVGSSAIDVTGFGFYDQGNNGLLTSHTVALWTSSGTPTSFTPSLLAYAIVPAGTSANEFGTDFRFSTQLFNAGGQSIDFVSLQANAYYTLVTNVITGANNDSFRDRNNGGSGFTAPVVNPAITFVGFAFGYGTPLVNPLLNGAAQPPDGTSEYVGPNMMWGAAPSTTADTPVPEPATLTLLGTGIALVARRARKRKR